MTRARIVHSAGSEPIVINNRDRRRSTPREQDALVAMAAICCFSRRRVVRLYLQHSRWGWRYGIIQSGCVIRNLRWFPERAAAIREFRTMCRRCSFTIAKQRKPE